MVKMLTMDKILSKKIKVNWLGGVFWLLPNLLDLFSASKRKASVRPYQSLLELVQENFLNRYDLVHFSFNGDHDFFHFNDLQAIRSFNFTIEEEQLGAMQPDEVLLFEPVDRVTVELDQKGLSLIHSGKACCASANYFKHWLKRVPQQDKVTLVWRKSGFELKQ